MNELQKVEFDLLCEAVKIFSDLKLHIILSAAARSAR